MRVLVAALAVVFATPCVASGPKAKAASSTSAGGPAATHAASTSATATPKGASRGSELDKPVAVSRGAYAALVIETLVPQLISASHALADGRADPYPPVFRRFNPEKVPDLATTRPSLRR